MLLFLRYLAPGKYVHFPILITNDNRLRIANMFNFLSERLACLVDLTNAESPESALNAVGADLTPELPTEKERRWVYSAMKSSTPQFDKALRPAFERDATKPWLVFVALHFRQPEVLPEVLTFVQDMVNRDDILEIVQSRSFEPGAYLIRLPLPLCSFIGKIVTPAEFAAIDALVQRLRLLRQQKGNQDHRAGLHALLAGSIIPIELAHKDSLVAIARADDKYHLQLH